MSERQPTIEINDKPVGLDEITEILPDRIRLVNGETIFLAPYKINEICELLRKTES